MESAFWRVLIIFIKTNSKYYRLLTTLNEPVKQILVINMFFDHFMTKVFQKILL